MRFLRDDGGCLVKRLLLLVVTCALLVPPVAYARDWGTGFGALVQTQGQPVKKGPGQFQRGDPDKRGEQDKRNHGRLTQEERRELHKDLDRANREIYRR
jgi:hypothetical protein